MLTLDRNNKTIENVGQLTLQLKFWGTRGSIPVSGPEYLRYGGNTSCVSLTSPAGHLFIFDCGSGGRELGNFLLSPAWDGPVHGHLLLSHTHWDHIQGFPFFGPVFRPGNALNIVGWGGEDGLDLQAILAGQMQQNYFPVSLDALPARLSFSSLQDRQSPTETGTTWLGGAKLMTRLLKHPLPSVGYRLELAGRSVVYATDHEPVGLPSAEALAQPVPLGNDIIDSHLIELAQDADVLIHDAQYSTSELAQKVGWGHSAVEVAVDTAVRANVRQLVLFHHDPAHDDAAIDHLLEAAQARAARLGATSLQILAAQDGLSLSV